MIGHLKYRRDDRNDIDRVCGDGIEKKKPFAPAKGFFCSFESFHVVRIEIICNINVQIIIYIRFNISMDFDYYIIF